MERAQEDGPAAKPTWKRIVDFPLVTMLIAAALFVLALTAAGLVVNLLPPMDEISGMAAKGAIVMALALLVYKLVIRRLGENPRDDLRIADAPKGLGLGLLSGFLVFSLVVGVAAIADVYRRRGRDRRAAQGADCFHHSARIHGGVGVPRHPVPLARGVRR
ncbi:MAG TPA: hypothetical protein VMN38_05705 [Sphingomicrobium sp.]|nr:hypothetical protein [Sphingomicrobium sp.]